MANFSDQADAIWKALDNMLQKDPEGYQRFIKEQMEEGRQSFGKEGGQGSSSKANLGPGSSKSGTNVKPFPNMQSLLNPLEQLLAGGRLPFDSKVQDSGTTSNPKNKPMKPKSQAVSSQKDVKISTETVSKPIETKEKKAQGQSQLLDDSIGTSIIGTIVPKKKAIGSRSSRAKIDDDDNNEEEVISDIQLPSDFSNKKKNKNGKPLIQEL